MICNLEMCPWSMYCCIECFDRINCSGMCACLPALCCWRWIVWCVHISCFDRDVHSCFELWTTLTQSSRIRRYINVTYYYNTKLCAVWLVCHLTCLDLGRGQLTEMSLNSDVMSSGFGSFEWSSAPWTSVMSLSFCEVIQLRIGFSRPGTTHRFREHEQYSLRSSAWNCSVTLKEYWFPYAEIVVLDFSSGGFGHSLL